MKLERFLSKKGIAFEEKVPLARYTTFKVGGPADYFLCPESQQSLLEVLDFLEGEDIAYLPLGGGSNLLVRDGGFRGAVLSLAGLSSVALEGELLVAEAGVSISRLLSFCSERGLSGLEFLVGVPATVGGAVVMNAGAFGREIKDVLEGVLVYHQGELEYYRRDDLTFFYRGLSLPRGSLVVSATFRLHPAPREEIKAQMARFFGSRKEKQPLSYPSAGSVFKNPSPAPAGFLIEAAGLKGVHCGGAEFSSKHANFIVNKGGACAQDILTLMELARERVFREFGITLEEEVRIVGEG